MKRDDNKNVVREQLALFGSKPQILLLENYFDRLKNLLQSNLDFHNQKSNYFSHNFHSFPAKFPPQLPKIFIEQLTAPFDIVLDPMAGSGTTIVEAFFSKRKGIGFDIDPLAAKIALAKITPLNRREIADLGLQIYRDAKNDFIKDKSKLIESLKLHFDSKTREFVDYWFLPDTQLELISLWNQIKKIESKDYRNFFEVVFSSVIITKSGGVSLAMDLGHTRPHKVKALFDNDGNILFGNRDFDSSKKRFLTKVVKSSFEEFKNRLAQNIKSVVEKKADIKAEIVFCDSQNLCLQDATVDLIVTSPPYASNAIDYMRAHKFSLVWFGYKIDDLSQKRNQYIGSESISNYLFEDLPEVTAGKIDQLSVVDLNRGKVLKRYYSEMKRSLKEMFRVLKPQKAAIVVVGSSIMKGIDTETQLCLKEIGESVGFVVPQIGIRQLDRNKRMMPAGKNINLKSQIQQRMHQEYVIGFYKP